MRIIMVVLSLIAVLTPREAASKQDKKVQIPNKPHAVGDRYTESSTASMSLRIKLGDKKTEVRNKEARIDTVEVTGVDEKGTITREKVSYGARTEENKGPGKQAKAANVLGKTYVLEMRDGEISVITDDGDVPPDDVIAAVRKDAHGLGRPDPISAVVSAQPLEVGKKTTIAPDQLGTLFGDEGAVTTVSDAAVTLLKIDGSRGSVGLDLTVTMVDSASDAHWRMTMPMHGIMTIDLATGWTVDGSLEGPITMTGNGVEGTGAFKVTSATTYGACDATSGLVWDETAKACRLAPGHVMGWAGCSEASEPPSGYACFTGTHWANCDCVCNKSRSSWDAGSGECK